jgi:hypothetical protein
MTNWTFLALLGQGGLAAGATGCRFIGGQGLAGAGDLHALKEIYFRSKG